MDAEIARQRFEREHDPARVLSLTDGVVAIIITLLVLEIHVPELSQGQTLKVALQEVRPSFFAFFISFVVVAISSLTSRSRCNPRPAPGGSDRHLFIGEDDNGRRVRGRT